MKEKAGEWAASVADRAEDAWSATRDEAREWAGAAATRAEDAAANAAQFIRRHPGASLLALFGLGFLLGMALRRMGEP